jgi:CRP-like cAMP-binding protein
MTDVLKSINSVNWESGTTIYKIGDEADYAYLLEKGEVEVLSKNSVRVGFINEKEVFGEQSILLNTKRTVTLKTTKDSVAIKIPKEKIIAEYQSSSKLMKAILRTTYLRLMNLDNTIKNNLDSII